MALYVFVTDECRSDAKKHSFETEVESFKRRIELEQSTTLFDNYPPPYLKKRFVRQLRLIAAERTFGEDVVVCFYRLLVRSSSDYEQFRTNAKAYGESHFLPLATDEMLTQWLAETTEEPPPVKPAVSDAERRFLWDVMGIANQRADILVCESPDWVRAVGGEGFRDRLAFLCNPVLELALSEAPTSPHTGYEAAVGGRPGWSIIGRFFPARQMLFLVAPITEENRHQAGSLRERYGAVLAPDDREVSDETLLRMAARAYPAELLADETLWLAAERDEAANLALSPEEGRILQSVHTHSTGEQQSGFPLFINGRAGSGKSTILQYLFADYLELHLSREDADGEGPLYLTYSPELLQEARGVAEKLLACGARYLDRKQQRPEAAAGQDRLNGLRTQSCFREFRPFMLGMLQHSERTARFTDPALVDFRRFRQLWHAKFSRVPGANRDIPPDICWHVIRTYIKGLSPDDYIDPEDYEELPRDERTVSPGKFREVYEKVWQAWYQPKCDKGDCWDDQDLARFLLTNGRVTPTYPAIFCDEAQDFTRIELEVLLRLSIFSNRKLSPQDLNRVPFAFAGDPFQTLNPTGFRWDAIKSTYFVKFVLALDPARQSQVRDLNYHELTYNYRSSGSIVRLCNTVQALRSVLFDIRTLKPQVKWQLEPPGPSPVWYDRGSPEVDGIRKQKDLAIIIPCERGEEAAFVDSDQFLRSFVQRDDAGVPLNVLSPARVKGLERDRVVLYGFGGSTCPKDLAAAMGRAAFAAQDRNVALPWEYYLNHLYVGASRAKRRLFLVDEACNYQRFLRFATDEAAKDGLLDALGSRRAQWEPQIGLARPGTAADWEDRGEQWEDLRSIAEQYEREGIAQRDSYLLRSAAMIYRDVGDTLKEACCRGRALLLEGKYPEAGESFEQCEQFDLAVDAYWHAKAYDRVTQLGKRSAMVSARLEPRLADWLVNEGTPTQAADLLTRVVAFRDDRAPDICARPGWSDALRAVFDRLAKGVPAEAVAVEWMGIRSAADSLVASGLTLGGSTLGALYYQAEDDRAAVEAFRRARATAHELYGLARSRLLASDFEGGLLKEATRDDARFLAEHYLVAKKARLALRVLGQFCDVADFGPALKAIQAAKDVSLHVDALVALLEAACRQESWDETIRLIRDNALPSAIEPADWVAAAIAASPWTFRRSATAQLAQADALRDADGRQVKNPIESVLAGWYPQEENAEWLSHVCPELIGAAIEHVGLDITCLRFYEFVRKAPVFSVQEKRRARVRWVVCKLRQASRVEEQGQRVNAEKYRAEASDEMTRAGLSGVGSEPESPDISGFLAAPPKRRRRTALSTQPAQPEPTPDRETPPEVAEVAGPRSPDGDEQPVPDHSSIREPIPITVGPFHLRFYPSRGRLNIEHEDSRQVAVKPSEGRCDSLDVEIAERDSIFALGEWGVSCDLSHFADDGHFEVRFADLGVSLSLSAGGGEHP